jgi:hypothetical protein
LLVKALVCSALIFVAIGAAGIWLRRWRAQLPRRPGPR